MRLKSLLTMAMVAAGLCATAQTISTNYSQPGIGGVVLDEFIANQFVKPLELPLNNSLSQAPATMEERIAWLNSQNAGAQILDAFVPILSDPEKLEENMMMQYTQKDLDDMTSGVVSDRSVKDQIIMRQLKNNYVLFITSESDKPNKKKWEMYQVDLTPELYNAFMNVLGEKDQYPQVPMKFAGKGSYDQETVDKEYEDAKTSKDETDNYAVFRRLTKEIPDLGIGGPIINSHPYRARIPEYADVKKLQRFYVYRTVDKNGELKSKQLGVSYVTRVEGDEVQLYTLDGRSGSPKRGDYAVFTNGGKQALSISGFYGLEKNGNYPGVRIGYDMMQWLLPIGVSGHLMADIDVQFMGRGQAPFQFANGEKLSYVHVVNGSAYGVHPNPMRGSVGVGYGVAYNFMGRFSVMPYVRVNGTYVDYFSVKENASNYLGSTSAKNGTYLPVTDQYGNIYLNDQNKASFFGVRGDAGLRFSVNIVKQISIFVGAEYNYHYGISGKSEAGISASKYFYDSNYMGHGKSAINFMLGVRMVTF